MARPDIDPLETRDWLDALDSVLEVEGPARTHELLEQLVESARRSGVHLPFRATTAYRNTIAPAQEPPPAGQPDLEKRIRSIVRWNAMAMVVRANRDWPGIGGHIASYQSAATLYEVGFNHFFRGGDDGPGDLIYIQGHCSPGIYARAFLEGRLDVEALSRFRRELGGGGLSSYPHPWSMPDFWQFPTVSMGLGPITAIYQARLLKYLHNRGILDAGDRKVWCFCGDGEMDEPESLGAIWLASREKLDNLIFVVNCNLQRLDGPVRGNGKIIQELEGEFRGAGWNVLKVIWGSRWDRLLARDHSGKLQARMESAVDGDYQAYKAHGGAYTREHFFGAEPELAEMVADMTDEDIWLLNRGGHDPHKIYAAYHAAVRSDGRPTVILAKTVKGYGMGEAGEGKNFTHQQKKMGEQALKAFRDRYRIPISDEDVLEAPFYKPAEDSAEMRYLHERRRALGGYLPARRPIDEALEVPALEAFDTVLKGSGDREVATTMALVRLLTILTRDPSIGARVVPIVPDEARTFGMEGMFRQLGIYASEGQLYEPVDSDQVLYYREDRTGQILEEGICEAGAASSWIAAGTSYANHGVALVPFYIFYSMFGFQRVGDLFWAAGDARTRGFLVGGTFGRTTLEGEGLQHQDGHSHLLAATVPNCVAWDPAYSYELAVIVHEGLQRMFVRQEDVYFYITVHNEPYPQPALPDGAREGILRGMHRVRVCGREGACRVRLLGGGALLREALAAAEMLESDWGVGAEVWSVTSFNELRRDGVAAERWSMLHPDQPPRTSWVARCLGTGGAPVVAVSDSMKMVADQIRGFVPAPYVALGTDGFGRSDTREALRSFFEVDRRWVCVGALSALVARGDLAREILARAIERYDIDPDAVDPTTA